MEEEKKKVSSTKKNDTKAKPKTAGTAKKATTTSAKTAQKKPTAKSATTKTTSTTKTTTTAKKATPKKKVEVKEEVKEKIQEEVKEVVEEKVVEEVKEETSELSINNNKKFVVIGIVIVAIIAIIILLSSLMGNKLTKPINKSKSAKNVIELLPIKYDEIACYDNCNYYVALQGNELTGKYTFFNKYGKKVGMFDASKLITSSNISIGDVSYITDNYYIIEYLDTKKLKTYSVVYNKKGKVLYQGEDAKALTDNFFTVAKDDKNSIYNLKGKELFTNVKYIESINDEKLQLISFKSKDSYKVIDEKGNVLFNGYDIAKARYEDDMLQYVILEDHVNNNYRYYSIKDKKFKGEPFDSYTTADTKTLITKKVNDKSVKYLLNNDGTIEQYKEDTKPSEVDTRDLYKKIKDLGVIEESYSIVNNSLFVLNQENIVVYTKDKTSYGILNVNTKEYSKLGDFLEGRSYPSISVEKLDKYNGAKDNMVLISCSKYNCDVARDYIYNLTSNKLVVSKDESTSSLIDDYTIYSNGYTLVKNDYSLLEDSRYRVLYDKNNKEVIKSKSDIYVLDAKVLYSTNMPSVTYGVGLYSVKDKAIINEDSQGDFTSVNSMLVGGKKVYHFKNGKKINLLTLDNGSYEIAKLKGDYLSNNENGISTIVDNEEVNYYNLITNKTSVYKLKENESVRAVDGEKLEPYRDVFFINNTASQTAKVVNAKGREIFKVNKASIYDAKINKDGSVSLFIKNQQDLVGVYIVK